VIPYAAVCGVYMGGEWGERQTNVESRHISLNYSGVCAVVVWLIPPTSRGGLYTNQEGATNSRRCIIVPKSASMQEHALLLVLASNSEFSSGRVRTVTILFKA
jgi:hypothetical protein